jgi:hypothetical protein
MDGKLERFKPAVSRRTLLLLAALAWIGAGAVLLSFTVSWLRDGRVSYVYVRVAGGLLAALVIHHFGFSRVVNKNLARIMPVEGKRCAFSFFSWKSYLTIGFMMGLGAGLRHSSIPKPHLAVLYLGIGLALILSSTRYVRVVLSPPPT